MVGNGGYCIIVPELGSVYKSLSGDILLDSAIKLYIGAGKVEFTIMPLEIKMTVQKPVNLYEPQHGLMTDIYTERIHVANIPGAVLPPFRLRGPVPGTEYSIDQSGASAVIKCHWSNVSTMLTTVALPYTRTAAYKASYDKIRSFGEAYGITR